MLGEGTEGTLFVDIVFWVTAVSSIIAAIAVVQMKDMFRAALFLNVSFIGVAAMFVLLRAEFLAVIQILIYVGAISVLILFAILMTRDVEAGSPSSALRYPAGVLAAAFAAAAIFVAVTTEWSLIETARDSASLSAETVAEVGNVFGNTVPWIARLLIRDYVLAFEIAGVLLLAAVIGAVALVREN